MAYQEAATALDYVSLHISAYSSDLAQQTMSPGLKQMATQGVPSGSLALDQIVYERPPEEIEEDKLLTKGWKTEGLRTASNALNAAAERAKKEVSREAKFWEQVMRIREEGWTISKDGGKGRGGLAVRYGFMEATEQFRNKGIGPLRRGEDGSIILSEMRTSVGKEKKLRVRIFHGENVVGMSVAKTKPPSKSEVSDAIERARDALFEEELFFELMRESRSLAVYGVESSEHTVTVSIGENKRAVIDLVSNIVFEIPGPLTDCLQVAEEEDSPMEISNKNGQKVASAIWHALHLLLIHMHKMHLKRRSILPPPLTGGQRKQPPLVFLLRPIATYITHYTTYTSIKTIITKLGILAKSANLSSTFSVEPFKSLLTPLPKSTEEVSPLDPFLVPLDSTITAIFPGSLQVVITIRTFFFSPINGNRFSVTVTTSENDTSQYPKMDFSDFPELRAYLLWCFELGVVTELRAPGGWEHSGQPNEAILHVKDESTEKVRWMKAVVESENKMVVEVGYLGDLEKTELVLDGRGQKDLKELLGKEGIS